MLCYTIKLYTLLICQNTLIKVLDIKFRQNPSSGSRVIACGRTDGHDEATGCLSHLSEHTQKVIPKHVQYVSIAGAIYKVKSALCGAQTDVLFYVSTRKRRLLTLPVSSSSASHRTKCGWTLRTFCVLESASLLPLATQTVLGVKSVS